MKLWVFGQSLCMPFKLAEYQGWPFLLSKKLNIEYENLSQAGTDNFFIYHTFLENYQRIKDDDIVVIGWSHPSRKTFIVDKSNTAHTDALSYSLHYVTQTQELMRSDVGRLRRPDSKSKWSKLSPLSSGFKFYDTWFDNYYSEHEQCCNFQSYLDSVRLRCPGNYFPFYFSKESVEHIDARDGVGHMLEFVIDNNVAISDDDYHLNVQGHVLWTDCLIKKIKECNVSIC